MEKKEAGRQGLGVNWGSDRLPKEARMRMVA